VRFRQIRFFFSFLPRIWYAWPLRGMRYSRGPRKASDRFTPEKRSEIMRRVKSRNTSTEISVRKLLHRLGLRFRLHRRDLAGKPDIVLPRHHVVVFVNGCFWHQHACKRGTVPATNHDWWSKKLTRNVERDRANALELKRLGWRVLTVWECELSGVARLERKVRRFFERGAQLS